MLLTTLAPSGYRNATHTRTHPCYPRHRTWTPHAGFFVREVQPLYLADADQHITLAQCLGILPHVALHDSLADGPAYPQQAAQGHLCLPWVTRCAHGPAARVGISLAWTMCLGSLHNAPQVLLTISSYCGCLVRWLSKVCICSVWVYRLWCMVVRAVMWAIQQCEQLWDDGVHVW